MNPGPLPRRLAVLGGYSDIALATVDVLAQRGLAFVALGGRKQARLAEAADGLRQRHRDLNVATFAFDAGVPETHRDTLDNLDVGGEPLDSCLVAFGELGPPFTSDADPAEVARLVTTNFAGAASSVLAATQLLERDGGGRVIVLSSITAVRPRAANLAYGSAKAGLDAFVTNLAELTADSGVHIVTVRPGFVHTSMTEGVDPAPFATTPEEVANDIVAGLSKGDDVVWSPAVLRGVAPVLKSLPGPLWRRLSR